MLFVPSGWSHDTLNIDELAGNQIIAKRETHYSIITTYYIM